MWFVCPSVCSISESRDWTAGRITIEHLIRSKNRHTEYRSTPVLVADADTTSTLLNLHYIFPRRCAQPLISNSKHTFVRLRLFRTQCVCSGCHSRFQLKFIYTNDNFRLATDRIWMNWCDSAVRFSFFSSRLLVAVQQSIRVLDNHRSSMRATIIFAICIIAFSGEWLSAKWSECDIYVQLHN